MLNPAAILEQAFQQPLPERWHIFYGKGRPIGLSVISCLLAFIFIGILQLALLFFLGPFSILSWLVDAPPNIPSGIKPAIESSNFYNFVPSLLHLSIYFWILPILVAVLVAVVAYSNGTRLRNSLLVLTPDGVVECRNYTSERRKFKVLDFAAVKSLALQLHANDDSNQARVWLDIQKVDGDSDRWPIDSRYGAVEAIVQYIIEDHALFVVRGEQQTI
ncbi:hypothetical protein KDA_19320 [Dictyobacter alpinus]|uniref:Uncharacterized protein n=1 Tax=Dictyobacter alpinus TaxID=2014873 RepID=A0A402B522_9CHLR|nr:hypothetical protein [Dictyobacter alpinus]GCE26448.1 hypothetical protein KDA_19320 [Dictyobacter alpinus]